MSTRLRLGELLLDPKEFSFFTGAVFRGLSITPAREGGWNVIIRAFRGNQAVYAMNVADDPHDGVRRLLWALRAGYGHDLWRKDKYFDDGGVKFAKNGES